MTAATIVRPRFPTLWLAPVWSLPRSAQMSCALLEAADPVNGSRFMRGAVTPSPSSLAFGSTRPLRIILPAGGRLGGSQPPACPSDSKRAIPPVYNPSSLPLPPPLVLVLVLASPLSNLPLPLMGEEHVARASRNSLAAARLRSKLHDLWLIPFLAAFFWLF